MENDLNDASPTSLNHIYGQRNTIDQIKVALDSSHQDNLSFPTTLLVGPPGLGKSQIAKIISCEMAADFHEVLGQSLKNSSDLNGLLLSAGEKAVVHIDEAHLLNKENQTALYMAIDKRTIFVGTKSRTPQPIFLNSFSLVLSTTDEYLLLAPLRDRAKLTLRLDYYDEGDLMKITSHRALRLGWDIHEKVIPLIAFRAKGTPRLALRMMENCRRVCRSLGETTITEAHLNKACELEGLDFCGLNPTEQKYLKVVEEGDSHLNVIASRLGLPSRTVSQVIEPFLLRAELITKDEKGCRLLTQIGRGHLSDLREQGKDQSFDG